MTILSDGDRLQGWTAVIPKQITSYLDVRAFEWAFSIPMIFFGVYMLAVPAAANGSILHVLVSNIGGLLTALTFIFTGITGIVALIANGASKKIGPRLRALCAVIRSVLWITFVLSMAQVSRQQPWVSPMVFFWSSFTLTEVYISYRAGLDVRPSGNH